MPDESPVVVPSHPLNVKPAGNAYVGHKNIKSAAGLFFILPDELIVNILEYLGPSSLLQLGSTCKALYAFSRLEEFWKTLFVEYGSPSGRDLISTAFRCLVELDVHHGGSSSALELLFYSVFLCIKRNSHLKSGRKALRRPPNIHGKFLM